MSASDWLKEKGNGVVNKHVIMDSRDAARFGVGKLIKLLIS